MSYNFNRPSRSGDDFNDDEDDEDDQDEKKSSPPPRSPMFGSSGSKPGDRPGSSSLNRNDPPKKDDPPRTSSSPLGAFNRGGTPPNDKKDTGNAPARPNPGAAVGGLFNRGGNNPPDDKDKKDTGNAPARPNPGAAVGGLFNRGGNNPPNDKDKDKKDAGNTPARPNPVGAVGGLFNRGGNNPPNDKDKDKKDAGNAPARPNPGAAIGGLFNRGKTEDDKSKDAPKSPASSPPGSSKPPTSTFGSGSSSKPGDKPAGTSGGSSSVSGSAFGSRPGGSSTGSPGSGSGGSSAFGSRPAGSSGFGSGSSGSSGSGSSGSGSTSTNRPFGSSGSTSPTSTGGSKPSGSSPFGSKPADPKPADPPKPSGGLFGNRTPDPKAGTSGSTSSKPGDAKPASGGVFGGSKPADPKPGASAAPKATAKGDAPKINNPLTSAASSARNTLNSITGRLPFGNKPADAPKDPNKPATPKGTFASSASGATARPGISSTPGKKVPAARGEKQARPLDGKSKEVVVKRTFSKDHQLDLLGIGLIILGAIIFFGLLSPGTDSGATSGSVTGAIVKLLGQAFGYGRIIWPIPCLAIGGWLIIRHFGDEPPVLEYTRAIGWAVMYVGFVTTLQWLELLQKPVPTLQALGKISALAAIQLRGGGWLGDKLYMFAVGIFGNSVDYALPVVLVGWWVVAIMLAFSITLAEITSYAKSVGHFFGRARNGYMERKTQAATAAALAAETAQKQAPLTVEAPAPAVAPALADGAAKGSPLKLAATTKAPPETTATPTAAPLPLAVGGTPVAAEVVPAGAAAAPASKPSPVRGLFNRGSSAPAPATASAATATAEPKPAGSPAPVRPGLFGARPASGLEPSKNPLTPAAPKPDEKPAAVGDTDKLSATSATPAAKPADADKPDSKPAAPKSPIAGIFGSRSAPAKTDDKPADKTPVAAATDSKPAPFRLFGSRSTPAAAPTDAAKSEPVKVAESAKPGDQPADKPAETPKAAPAASRPGLFGSRPAATTAPTTDKPAESKTPEQTATPKAPIGASSGLFGSRPSVAPTSTPKDDEKPDVKPDNKPLSTPARPITPGLFGSRPTPPTASTEVAKAESIKAAESERKPEDEKPATPKTPIGASSGLFGSRPAFGTASTAAPAPKPMSAPSKPVEVDDEDDDEEDAKLPPATPKSPTAGLFGSRPATPSTPIKPAITVEEDGTDEEDDEALAKLPPATPKSPGLFGSRPLSATSSKPGGIGTPAPQPLKSTVDDLDDDELDDDLEDADDEPKYVALDDDAEPIPGRPAANRPLTPSLSNPRPVTPPVTPRSFSGVGSSSTVRPASTPAASTPAPAAPERAAPIIRQPAAFSSAPKPAESGNNTDNNKDAAKPPLEGVIVRGKSSGGWELPNYTELLEKGSQQQFDQAYLMDQARIIEDTLQSFGASGKVVEINSGPVITQFGVEPDYLVSRQGKKTRVKVSSIAKLDADLALALAARSIRIEAPVPGKGFVGIEVPNSKTALVSLRDIMDSDVYRNVKSNLRIGLGQSVDGAPIAADLTAMPHLLIAGTTGSGKSVCVNAIIASLLVENTPDDLKFIMVDPKRVELTGYNGIPHLVAPVVVDLERIVGVLKWVTREMDERYKKFSQVGARNIVDYNTRTVGNGGNAVKLPYLVVVIDELADLMMLAPDETEKVLTRLAQMARATGIHLIVSTQRPSVDVVTGLIKANFPARISFAVASSVDSKVILDQPGAEKLLGRGDMLYQAPDAAAPLRMQGVYVSDNEINKITRYWKTAQLPTASEAATPAASTKNVFDTPPEPVQSRSEKFGGVNSGNGSSNGSGAPKLFGSELPKPPVSSAVPAEEDDGEMYEEAVKLYRENNNKISISLLQRRLRVGYMRAARLIELLKEKGVITADESAAITEDGKGDK